MVRFCFSVLARALRPGQEVRELVDLKNMVLVEGFEPTVSKTAVLQTAERPIAQYQLGASGGIRTHTV